VSAKLRGVVELKCGHHRKEIPLEFEPVRLHHGHAAAPLLQLNDVAFIIPGDVRVLSTAGTTRLLEVSFTLDIEVHMTEVFVINPRVTVPVLIASPCCSAAVPSLGLALHPVSPVVVPANTPLLQGTQTGYGAV